MYDDDIILMGEDKVCENIKLNGDSKHVVDDEIKKIYEEYAVVQERFLWKRRYIF